MATNEALLFFNLAIDSKLRACDLVKLKVAEIQTAGRLHDRVAIIQKKFGDRFNLN